MKPHANIVKNLKVVNPVNGALEFQLFPFSDITKFNHKRTLNYYTLLLITKGSGKGVVDFSEFSFQGKSLLLVHPFQRFMLKNAVELEGFAVQFNYSLLSVPEEHFVASLSSATFNDWFTLLQLSRVEASVFLNHISSMYEEEALSGGLVPANLMVLLSSVLDKVVQVKFQGDITLKRLKTNRAQSKPALAIIDLIETNYRTVHEPELYVSLAKSSVDRIALDCKFYFNKTLAQLLTERLILEANKLLYLTTDSVEQIAVALGFKNEIVFHDFYFEYDAISPELFRAAVKVSNAFTRSVGTVK
jgi:AraC-like DNA-binding protein